jgi:hypothetical protein
MPHGGVRLERRCRRARVERIVLALDRPAVAGVAHAREALRDEAGDAGLARGGEQGVGAFRAEPVRRREGAVEVPPEARVRERGRLMDDRVGLRFQDGVSHGGGIEQIEHDRLGAERPYTVGTSRRRGGTDHLVPSSDQLGDEPGADRPARTYDEDTHRHAPFGHISWFLLVSPV